MFNDITVYSPGQVIVFRPRRRPLSFSFLERERFLHPDLGEEELVHKAERRLACLERFGRCGEQAAANN